MHSNVSIEKFTKKPKLSFAEAEVRIYNHKKKGKIHHQNKEVDYEKLPESQSY